MNRFFAVLMRILCVWTWPREYRKYIDKITTSGYISQPSTFWWFISRVLFRFCAFIWVGRIRIVGEENLRAPGRLIFCPNHSSLLDAVVMFPSVGRPVRAIGAYETLRTAGGLTGVFLTKIGVVPVDRSVGRTVIEPAIELMVRGDSLAMFPEGRISPTGQMLPFKLGPGYITAAAFERLGGGELIGLVPVLISYHRRHNATALHFWRMGFRWRGGVTVTVCKPIYLNDVEDRDPANLMRMVREAIEAVPCPTLPR